METNTLIISLSKTVSFPSHTQTRPRLEREREYEEYPERDSYPSGGPPPAGFAPPPVGFVDDYRIRSNPLPRDHRTSSREEEYPPNRSSSRRVLNAI